MMATGRYQKDLNKWRATLGSWLRRLHCVKMSILLRFTKRFNAVPTRMSPEYFVEIDKLILKFMRKSKEARRANTLVKNKIGGPTLPDLKTHYKAMTIVTVWCW